MNPVVLRSTTSADLDFVIGAESHAANRRFILPWSRERHQGALADSATAHWLVLRGGGREPVGFVLLHGRDSPDRSVEFRRLVVTEKGRGYGGSAVALVKQIVFERWRAHRLWLDVFTDNLRARRLYERQGFVSEGVLRECVRRGDAYTSLEVLSMLEHEYFRPARARGR